MAGGLEMTIKCPNHKQKLDIKEKFPKVLQLFISGLIFKNIFKKLMTYKHHKYNNHKWYCQPYDI